MKITKPDSVRISLSSNNSCHLKLTGISDPNASYNSANNRMWIEAPIERKYLLVSMCISKDVSFNIFLGVHSAQEKNSPSVLYKRLIINQQNLLSEEIATGMAPIILKYKAHKGEHLRMIIEWDVLDNIGKKQMTVPANITAEMLANMHATSCETEAEIKDRLDNWSILNDSLEKEQRLIQPLEYTVLDSKKLVYIVNSKVANTSIKFSMSEDFYDDDYSIHQALEDLNISVSKLTEKQKDYFIFTFVRNPFSRLVSCYVSKYHTDINIYKKEQNIFADYLDGYMETDEGFDRFIDKVCEIPYRLMDRHFRLQSDIVYDEEGRCRCDYIGKFENINEDFEPIRVTFNLHPLPHYNTTYMGNWMDFYTEETAKKVYYKYHRDFDSFGYSSEYSKLINYINSK